MSDRARPVPQAAANVLQAVVHRARIALHAEAGALPNGEPAVTWRELSGAVVVTWHADGRLAWVIEEGSRGAEPFGSTGARLLATALGEARAAGETPKPDPNGLNRDSIVFRIAIIRPTIDARGKLHPAEADVALPVFDVGVPRETLVAVKKASRKRFPHHLAAHGVGGHLLVNFVVDTTGRADMSTFHDASGDARSRLSQDDRRFYDDFLAAARDMVADSRYTPATIGGCLVRVEVRQPFTWTFQ